MHSNLWISNAPRTSTTITAATIIIITTVIATSTATILFDEPLIKSSNIVEVLSLLL